MMFAEGTSLLCQPVLGAAQEQEPLALLMKLQDTFSRTLYSPLWKDNLNDNIIRAFETGPLVSVLSQIITECLQRSLGRTLIYSKICRK